MITDNNKLLAEFLGWENHLKNKGITKVYINNEEYIQDWEYFDVEKNILITPIEMKFHTDWNWLMQVVEKIETISLNEENYSFYFGISTQGVLIMSKTKTGYPTQIVDIEKTGTKLKAVYNACIEFVKWYNEQNK